MYRSLGTREELQYRTTILRKKCPCLGEILLGDASDPCVVLQPGVPASHLENLRSGLPFLRHISVGGEVLNGRSACAWANLQFKVYSTAMELSRIYSCLMESIEANKKGQSGSVAGAFLSRLTRGYRIPIMSCDRSGKFGFPSLALHNWE